MSEAQISPDHCCEAAERVAAARGTLVQLDAHLTAIDAGEIDATATERAAIEGAVTALREFTG